MPQIHMIIIPLNIAASRVKLDLDEAHACWVEHALMQMVTTPKDDILGALDTHGLIRYRRTIAELHDDISARARSKSGRHRVAWAIAEFMDILRPNADRFSQVHHELWMAFVDSGHFPYFPRMESQTAMREEFEPYCIRCGEFLSESGMVELTARWQAEQAIRRGEREA
jgi:hypothetical protein